MAQASAKKTVSFKELRARRNRLVAEIAKGGFTRETLRERKNELLDVYEGLQDYYTRKAEQAAAKAWKIQESLHL